jgi:tRNA (guanine37-N1)-methyltransferase
MKFMILTLYPDMFNCSFSDSILKRAQENGLIEIRTKNIRDFAEGKRRNVDDTPFGGGAGMLMSPKPLHGAISWAKEQNPNSKVIYLSAQGKRFDQEKALKIAREQKDLILVTGHFEGIDERIVDSMVDEEISIGDFVLTGGEIPAMCIIDSVSRLLPNVINEKSTEQESYSEELFFQREYPQYTRPADFMGQKIPEVLLCGDHQKIEDWRMSHIKGLSQAEKRVFNWRLSNFPKKGRKVELRIFHRSDIDHWLKYLNDEEVCRFLTISPPFTHEIEEEFYLSSIKDLNIIPLSILDKKNSVPIGTLSLEITKTNPHCARLGICIFNKDYWNNGYGTDALKTAIDFVFNDADLKRVELMVFEDNKKAKHVYEKVGFKEVGLANKKTLKNGKFINTYIMELIKDE